MSELKSSKSSEMEEGSTEQAQTEEVLSERDEALAEADDNQDNEVEPQTIDSVELTPIYEHQNLEEHFNKHWFEEGFRDKEQYAEAAIETVRRGNPRIQEENDRLIWENPDGTVTVTDPEAKYMVSGPFTPTDEVTGEPNTEQYIDEKVNPGAEPLDKMLEDVEVPFDEDAKLNAELEQEFPEEKGPDIPETDPEDL